jgi:translation initiation factor 3 subunit G
LGGRPSQQLTAPALIGTLVLLQDGPSGGGLPTAGSGKPGGWVPPSLRSRLGGEGGGGEVMSKRRDENSVRVSNLSEDVTEDDLAELFGPFGPIQRIFVAKDRETGEDGGRGICR